MSFQIVGNITEIEKINEGEDYLYPAGYFVFVSFAPEIERAILQAA